MTLALVLVIAGILWGIHIALRERAASERGAVDVDAGWLYVAGIADDHEPVLVGVTQDLSKLAWPPLRSMRVSDRNAAETAIKAELLPYKLRGQWYDRDAALAYFAHLAERTAA